MVRVGDIVIVTEDNECLYCSDTVIHDIRNQYFIVIDMFIESEKDHPKSACKIMNGTGFFSWVDAAYLIVL